MGAPEMLLLSGGATVAPATTNTVVVQLTLDGMGCEACQAHVQGLLERSSGVVSAEVDFNKGSAEVVVAQGWGFDVKHAASKLEADGYTVLSVGDGSVVSGKATISSDIRTDL